MKRPIRLVAPFLLSAVLTSACLPYSYAPCTLPSRLRPGLVHFELPPVSWTSKLKSREWEAFHVCGSAVEA